MCILSLSFSLCRTYLLLDLSHELLGLVVLAGHDIGHTQVGQHDGGHGEDVVAALLDDRVVVADRLLPLALLVSRQREGRG